MNAKGALARLHHVGKVPLGIAMLALLLALLFEGSHVAISALALVGCAAAAWELERLLKRSRTESLVAVAAVVGACLLCRWLLGGSREAVNEFLFLAMMVWLVPAPLWLARKVSPPAPVLAAVGSFVIVSAWLSVSVLAEYDRWMLIVGIGAICLADTCAWFAGKRFGRSALAPEISPNKTWEGVLGAAVGVSVFAIALWWLYLAELFPHWLMLLVAVGVAGLAVLGDLVESVLKRQADVKDSGVMLQSHGGILDRIDSWLPVLPLLALLSTLLQ